MIFIQCIPPGQSNANKVVLLLKGMFSEHGIPKVIRSDNGPQYASAQFANFCLSWGITHETSSLHYPQSNGFAEACIKSVKHTLQQAKYSGANLHLALLALQATPIDTKLPSPAELLYQCQLRTTILDKICNSDPSAPQVCEQIDTCSESAKAQSWQMQQNTCATVCWSTSCNIWHPSKDLGSCYCDKHPPTEELSSMHQQWFHILLHMETPLWMQCQGSRHCPQWHNCHIAGSNQTLLLSGTTCITPICTMHAAHICCTCNTSNPDETGSSCSCHASYSEEYPSINACDIPCHTCATPKIWPCLHGIKMPDPGDLGTNDPDCPWTLFS